MGCSYSVSIDAGLPSRLSLLTQTKRTTTSPILHTWSSKIRRVLWPWSDLGCPYRHICSLVVTWTLNLQSLLTFMLKTEI